MEITSFILGVCAVIVVAMVVGTFMNYQSVKSLKEQVDILEMSIYKQIEHLQRDSDTNERKQIEYADGLHTHLYEEMNKLYGYVDSRNDKLESKFSNQMASGVEVKKALDKINKVEADLNDFVKMYRNQ